MSVHTETVHLGVAVIGFQQIQRASVVRRFERAESIVGKNRAVCGQFTKNGLADVG